MFDYIYVDICTFLVSYMIHQHETSWNSYEIYQKACMSFVPLPGQFEMDPLLGCWSRYLGTGAQDVAGRLGGATDQRQRRVFAVLSGVFHRSHDAFQQADPKTSGTWALNMKGEYVVILVLLWGGVIINQFFWWKLMTCWDIFCWELCWLAFCQSWCHHLNLRLYILYVFFEGIWKDSVGKTGCFIHKTEGDNHDTKLQRFLESIQQAQRHMTWQHKANRLGRTWDKFIMNELHGMTCGFIGASPWNLGMVFSSWWRQLLLVLPLILNIEWCGRIWGGFASQVRFLMISIGKYSLKII